MNEKQTQGPSKEVLPASRSSDCYDAVREAQQAVNNANSRLSAAQSKVEQVEMAFRKALPVGGNVPCTVAILPSGKVVVHVWVESASNPNQLHIVEAGYFTEDAKPRTKLPGEQLGAS